MHDVLVRVPDASGRLLSHRCQDALLEEIPSAIGHFYIKNPIVTQVAPDVGEEWQRISDVLKDIAECDDIETVLFAGGKLVEIARVDVNALPLPRDLRQRGRRINTNGCPLPPLDVSQQHAHVAADVEETPGGLEALDCVELLDVVGVAMVRALALKNEPRLLDVLIGVAPIDFLRRLEPWRDVHQRAAATAADTDRAVLLIEQLAIVASAHRARNGHDLAGLVMVLLSTSALVVGGLLDQGHR